MAVSKQETTCNAARQAGSARQTSPLTPLQTGTERIAGLQFIVALDQQNSNLRGKYHPGRELDCTQSLQVGGECLDFRRPESLSFSTSRRANT